MHLDRIATLAIASALALPCTAIAQRGQMAAPEFVSAGADAPFSRAVRVGRTIAVSGLARNARVEIECIAVRGGN